MGLSFKKTSKSIVYVILLYSYIILLFTVTELDITDCKAAFTLDTCSRIQVSRTSNLYPDTSGYEWIHVSVMAR